MTGCLPDCAAARPPPPLPSPAAPPLPSSSMVTEEELDDGMRMAGRRRGASEARAGRWSRFTERVPHSSPSLLLGPRATKLQRQPQQPLLLSETICPSATAAAVRTSGVSLVNQSVSLVSVFPTSPRQLLLDRRPLLLRLRLADRARNVTM